MSGTWWERFLRWLCQQLGHNCRRDANGTDVCRRCSALVSTAYSRGEWSEDWSEGSAERRALHSSHSNVAWYVRALRVVFPGWR